MPMPEMVLWRKIRQRQLGAKFRRQYTIDNRILDFYSPEIKLGIDEIKSRTSPTPSLPLCKGEGAGRGLLTKAR